MKNELHYYDIYPKVFEQGKEIEISIKPLGSRVAFDKGADYKLVVCSLDDGSPRDYPARGNFVECKPCVGDDGIMRFKHTFLGEQEHFIRLFDKKDESKRLFQLAVYSLNADLVGRYPFMGDFHMHTCRSDGNEIPAVVCANYRKHGYDFFAITDHQRYYPSLEAIDAFKDVPLEFTVIPGEEVHMPRVGDCINDIHIVNFGGNYSVNALLSSSDHIQEVGDKKELRTYQGADCPPVISPEEFRDEVLALAETLNIPDGIERFTYAACVWEFNHIRAGGGLGIFAHPYWISNVFQVPETMTNYILETKPFDAFEVLGGESYFEQNGFQALKYFENRANGINYPIVGSTDSHSSVNNPNAYVASTIVFAPENTREAIIAGVKDYYSVAVDGMSREFRLVGDFRLSRYACFLLNEFFPLHDDLCYEEGRLMKDYACGDESAADALRFINGRMKKQREKYFKF